MINEIGLTVARAIPYEHLAGLLSGSLTVHGGVIRDAGGRIVSHLVLPGASAGVYHPRCAGRATGRTRPESRTRHVAASMPAMASTSRSTARAGRRGRSSATLAIVGGRRRGTKRRRCVQRDGDDQVRTTSGEIGPSTATAAT